MVIRMLLFLWSMVIAQDIYDYPCPRVCECSAVHNGQEYIVDVVCSVPYIAANETNISTLQTNVTSVLHLYCSDILTSHLNDKVFQHLNRFMAIFIIECRLEAVSEYSLFGLSSLHELLIHRARNLYIHRKAFVFTPNIQRLTITSSGLGRFPEITFLSRLTFVNFTDNFINDLSIIENTKHNQTYQQLFVLILNKNRIREINITFYSYMPFLKYFAIADNSITYISSTIFYYLVDLEFVDISGNELLTLEANTFLSNVNLKVIGLGENTKLHLPFGVFDLLENIQVLDLHSTNVGDDLWELIRTISNVHEVQLADSGITCIKREMLENLTRLKYLDLSGNCITEILNYTFVKQTGLETLNLGNNSITFIAQNAFTDMQSLKNLDLRKNNISWISPFTFEHLHGLTLLNISYNRLKQFPTLSNCSKLFVIDLRYNVIKTLNNDSFEGLTNLGGINLNWNSIENIPVNLLKPTPNLQLFGMSHNDVTMINRATFKGLNKLKWISLDYNKISDISYIFTELPSLIQLDLSHNSILGFVHSGYFYNTFNLQEIHLSFNKISGISSHTFYNLIYLEVVDLMYNKITSLSPRSVSFSPKVKRAPVFHLKGNPFACDCELEWMRKCVDRWTRECKGFDVHEFEFLTCYRGYRIKSYSLMKDVPIRNMLCEYEDHCNDSCKCCHLDQCKCRVTCPLYCTCLMSHSRERGIVDCSKRNFKVMNESIPSVTVTLYLDGNAFHVVEETMFTESDQLETLYLNDSKISHLKDFSFKRLNKLKVLFLNMNKLEQVGQNSFAGLESLEFINLEENIISDIAMGAFSWSLQLKVIRLANNRLVSPSWNFSVLNSLDILTLKNNQWPCDCFVMEQLKTLTYTMADIIIDRDEIYCFENKTQNITKISIIEVDLSTLCQNHTHFNYSIEISNHSFRGHLQALITILVLFTLVVIISIVTFLNRTLLQVLLYNKFGFKFCREKVDMNKIYDGFVSYSHKDEYFVVHELLPKLETEEGYKLCVHFRDFPVGATIADTIIDSIENSQRTILIISNNFLDSEWCQYEFKTAHHNVLKEKSKKIILILMDNIDSSKLDEELKLYLKTKTYLKYKDPWFWEKLLFAMPEIKKDDHQLNDMNKVNAEVELDVQKDAIFHENVF